MTLAELRELQGSPAPVRNFVWDQQWVDRDGYARHYWNITPCDSDEDILLVELRKGFHHWLSGDEIDEADRIWHHRQEVIDDARGESKTADQTDSEGA